MTNYQKLTLFMRIWVGATLSAIWPLAKIILTLSALAVALFLILYYGGIIAAIVSCFLGLALALTYDEATRKYQHAVEREKNKIFK